MNSNWLVIEMVIALWAILLVVGSFGVLWICRMMNSIRGDIVRINRRLKKLDEWIMRTEFHGDRIELLEQLAVRRGLGRPESESA